MNNESAAELPQADESYGLALSALIDNELPKDECAALLDRVAGDPLAAQRISSYRAQISALQALFPVDRRAVLPIVIPRRQSWVGRASVATTWTVCGLALGLMSGRSEEHTSELQSLMRISYAVF